MGNMAAVGAGSVSSMGALRARERLDNLRCVQHDEAARLGDVRVPTEVYVVPADDNVHVARHLRARQNQIGGMAAKSPRAFQ